MAWRDVSKQADLIKWDGPKMLEGAYVSGVEKDGEFGVNIVHTVETNDGRVAFYGTSQLNEALSGVQAGTLVKVEYTGETRKTSKGFRVKVFHISVWDSESDGTAQDEKVPF